MKIDKALSGLEWAGDAPPKAWRRDGMPAVPPSSGPVRVGHWRGSLTADPYLGCRRGRANAMKPGKSPRRLALVLGIGIVVTLLVAALHGMLARGRSFPVPSAATLARLSVPQRIVAIAESQVGYSTEPSSSYCNKFSAFWRAGTAGCPSGEAAEEWCADFAAWAWRKAGAEFTYGYGPGEINGAAVSFYQWALAIGQWHRATSGYVAAPGDVAVYGLSVGPEASAEHVAIVTADAPGQPGPDVVNGDGDRTGFSVVENGTEQLQVVVGQDGYTLAGYVSPPGPLSRRP